MKPRIARICADFTEARTAEKKNRNVSPQRSLRNAEKIIESTDWIMRISGRGMI